jgi:hypothetical protein
VGPAFDPCCAGGCSAGGACPSCGGCGGVGCPFCGGGCNFNNRWYVDAEYLLWWTRNDRSPPLVTAPPTGSTNTFANPLVDGKMSSDPRSGARVTAGYWFTDDHCLGVEVSAFGLGDQRFNRAFTGLANTNIFRPFFVPGGGTGAELVSFPGRGAALDQRIAGTVAVADRTSLWGYEVNLKSCLLCGCDWHLDGLVGYRGLRLDGNLSVTENLVTGSNSPAPLGTTFQVVDSFKTTNLFNGGQLGLDGECRWGDWSLGAKAKVALGPTHQTVDIFGRTVTTVPGGVPVPVAGGLLAQTTNMGHYSRDQFSVVPEFGLTLGYQCTQHIRALVGYNFLYWSSVALPGKQIDPVVDPRLVPHLGGAPTVGATRPAFPFASTDFWAQGLTAGFEVTF